MGFSICYLHFYLFDIDIVKKLDEQVIKNHIYQYFRDWDEEIYDY